MKRLKDLREYLDALKSLNDLEVIDRPVSAILEASAITRLSTEELRPAPLFTQIDGFKSGFRLVGAVGALSSIRNYPLARIALAFGLPYNTPLGKL